jgi:hypothetical protein
VTDKEAAKRFKVKRFGVFNVLDRKEYADYKKSGSECPSVRLWEAPIKSVWNFLVGLVAAKGRMSNIFEEVLYWGSQIIELTPEKAPFCGPVDDDTVHIKMFGSLEERQELRQAMKEATPAIAAAAEEEEDAETEAAPKTEPEKKTAPAPEPEKKAAPAPKKAEAPKPTPAPVAAPAPAAAVPASNSAQSMRDKIEAIRKKHAMKAAGK